MPRFFYHLCDGTDLPDLQGTVLPDLAAARVEALRFLRSILSERPKKIWDGHDLALRVTNEQDLTLFTLTISTINSPATMTFTVDSQSHSV